MDFHYLSVKTWVLSPRCSQLPLQYSSAAFFLPDTTQQEATALLLGIGGGASFSFSLLESPDLSHSLMLRSSLSHVHLLYNLRLWMLRHACVPWHIHRFLHEFIS